MNSLSLLTYDGLWCYFTTTQSRWIWGVVGELGEIRVMTNRVGASLEWVGLSQSLRAKQFYSNWSHFDFLKAQSLTIGMRTNLSREGSVLFKLVPNLITFQNAFFAIQTWPIVGQFNSPLPTPYSKWRDKIKVNLGCTEPYEEEN